MKKIFIFLIIILFITISLPINCHAGMKIWPGKLYININEWNQKIEKISYPIQVTNPYNFGINVTTKKEIPNNASIESGYTIIPDLSWIEITPDMFYIPPKSSREFNIYIKVPENKQYMYYNEKWDVRAVFSSDIYLGTGVGMQFQVELAVKLLIKTPEKEIVQSQYNPIYIFLIIFGICLIFTYLFLKKISNKSKYVYYFKKNNK